MEYINNLPTATLEEAFELRPAKEITEISLYESKMNTHSFDSGALQTQVVPELLETKYITSVLVSLFFIYDFSALCLASFILLPFPHPEKKLFLNFFFKYFSLQYVLFWPSFSLYGLTCE